jgi:hypothetical protein
MVLVQKKSPSKNSKNTKVQKKGIAKKVQAKASTPAKSVKDVKKIEESKENMWRLYNEANDRLELIPGPKSLPSAHVKGYDLNKGLDYSKMFSGLKTMGFQATNVGRAIEKVN